MLVKFIGVLLCILAGAWDIYGAVNAFDKGHYFLFGVDIMLAVWMAASIFQIVLEGRV